MLHCIVTDTIEIIHHKTYELVNIINSKCDLIITMNITYSLAKALCDKDLTIVYFVSCSRDIKKLCKERYFIATSHMKIYRTREHVYFSSSNLSLSSWDEITIKVKRSNDIDKFINNVISKLKLRNDFVRAFH